MVIAAQAPLFDLVPLEGTTSNTILNELEQREQYLKCEDIEVHMPEKIADIAAYCNEKPIEHKHLPPRAQLHEREPS